MQKKTLKVAVKMLQISGNTYPHRSHLKQLGFSWNAKEKLWECIGANFTKEMNKLQDLDLSLNIVTKNVPKNFQLSNIASLPDSGYIPHAILALVRGLKPAKSFYRDDQSEGHYQHFLLVDETGVIPCVAWDLAGVNVLANDYYFVIENAYIKVNKGNKELHCNPSTQFHVISDATSHIDPKLIEKQFISWLKRDVVSLNNLQADQSAKIFGMITDFGSIRDYDACARCLTKITSSNRCVHCGKDTKVIKRLVFSAIVDDGSDALKITLFGRLGRKLLGLEASEYEQLTQLSVIERLDSPIVVNKTNELIGKAFVFTGRTKLNESTNQLEFIVNTLSSMN